MAFTENGVHQQSHAAYDRTVRACAWLAVLLGASVLLGWQIHNDWLIRGVQGYVTMNPLSAVCFIACGLSLHLLQSQTPWKRQAGIALAGFAFLAAAWLLVSNAIGYEPSPDHLLYAESTLALSPVSVMHHSTAFGVMLASSGLLVLGLRKGPYENLAQYLAIALGIIALFAIVGYSYGAGLDAKTNPLTLPSLHTALGFILLAMGILASVPNASLMSVLLSRDETGHIFRLMVAAAILIPGVLGWISIRADELGYIDFKTAETLVTTWSMLQLLVLTFVTVQVMHKKSLERIRHLAEIRAERERLSGILSIAGEAIISVDSDHRITLFNSSAERTFGYSSAEILGKPVRILLPDESLWPDVAELPSSAPLHSHRGERRCDIEAVRKDKSVFPAEASLSQFQLGSDTIGTIVLRDLTDQRKAAQDLIQAKEKAEAAMQAETEFLANMSHEIRTPLNSISGFTQLLLQRNDLPNEPQNHVKKIRNATSALISIVNDILDYSKLETSSITLSKTPMSPFQLANNCTSIVSSISDLKRIPVRIDVEPGLDTGFFLGDPYRIQQIILNLLSNALKFTDDGAVTIRIEEVSPGSDPANILISVSDTGIGIPNDRLDKLFQRFSQVDGSMSRSYDGSGLGLAICKRLVNLMGGEIGVTSTPGVGSTFWFQLPLARTDAPIVKISPEGERQTSSSPRSILLVEDVELNQEIAVAMLATGGHRVDVADNGAAALEMVEAGQYDLVLMDIQMPVMDGVTAAKTIRQKDSFVSDIPIVALTANVLPDEVARFYAAGMSGHLRKPIDCAELLEMVDKQTRPSGSRLNGGYRSPGLVCAAEA